MEGHSGNGIMLHSKRIREVLYDSLKSVDIDVVKFHAEPLTYAALISSDNGAILSYAIGNLDDHGTGEAQSFNNLKMMSLLIADKWNEDLKREQESKQKNVDRSNNTRYVSKFSSGEEAVVYTYDIEGTHACAGQVPRSDLILLLIGSIDYPYGLLSRKTTGILASLEDLYGYKLG